MSTINQVTSVNLSDLIRNSSSRTQNLNEQMKPRDFGETISDFIQAVNQQSRDSSQKVSDVIQGRSHNLHEAMASLEESGLSFKLMVEIRNKLLESYKEIERMPV